MSNVLKFECIDNARQLGGIPAGVSRVKQNALFRSGNLSRASEHDLLRLRDDFGVSLVIDLRSDFEYMRKPDKLIDGMQSTLIPILDESMHGDAFNKNQVVPATGVDFMEFLFGIARYPFATELKDKLYNYFVESEYASKQYAKVFEAVLAQKGAPVLFHCTSGKDRAGFCSALMLAASCRKLQIVGRVAKPSAPHSYVRTLNLYRPLMLRIISLTRRISRSSMCRRHGP